MDAEYWYFVTFWGYMTSTAFFIFGQMVLLVALLKVTKICCLFIPTSSEVYDCNLWYNQIQMPPPISAGESLELSQTLFQPTIQRNVPLCQEEAVWLNPARVWQGLLAQVAHVALHP